MDIYNILSSLNVNTSDQDAVQGTIAALNALKKGDVWPPAPPPPPTDPPLPPPPKPPRPPKRPPRGEGGDGGNGGDLTPEEKRSITYNRTLEVAKTRLQQAEELGLDQEKIDALRNAIADMEKLTEDLSGSIQDLSQEDFDGMIDKTLRAIQALGIEDDELKIYSEEEHKRNLQQLDDILNDDNAIAELEDEDEAEREKDAQRKQNLNQIKRPTYSPTVGKFEGFEAFVNSLYKAIMLQVQIAETDEDTWTAVNRRYHGSGVLKQGSRTYDTPSDKVPIIDFYFDTSGSWGQADIAMGRKAQKALQTLADSGKIGLNTYYFSDGVSTEYGAVAGGGTYAWEDILNNIRQTGANNAVIMTDGDMNGQAGRYGQQVLPGCVWYLWKNGKTASRITHDLRGSRGTMQFAFSSEDAWNAQEEEQADSQNN